MDTAEAVDYVLRNSIKGAFVECGVKKGKQEKLMISILKSHGKARDIYMYDTFEGMTEPTAEDYSVDDTRIQDWSNKDVVKYWRESQKDGINKWCYCSLERVRKFLSKQGYPKDRLFFIKGDVEKTLDDKENLPKEISVLRLDTDWYESSKKEMEVLYPLLVSGGVLILDDYFHWQGQKKATDEYFKKHNINVEVKRSNVKTGYIIKP